MATLGNLKTQHKECERKGFDRFSKLPKRLRALISILWVNALCVEHNKGNCHELTKCLFNNDNIDKSHPDFWRTYRYLKRKSQGELCARYNVLHQIEKLNPNWTAFLYHPFWQVISDYDFTEEKLRYAVKCLPPNLQEYLTENNELVLNKNWQQLAQETNLDAVYGLLLLSIWLNTKNKATEFCPQTAKSLAQVNESLYHVSLRLFFTLMPTTKYGVNTYKYLKHFCRALEAICGKFNTYPQPQSYIKFAALDVFCDMQNKQAKLLLATNFTDAHHQKNNITSIFRLNISYQLTYLIYQGLINAISHSRYLSVLPNFFRTKNQSDFLSCIKPSELHHCLYYLRGKAFCFSHGISHKKYQQIKHHFKQACANYQLRNR